MPETLKIGTRGSELALWQANHVADLLRAAYPDITVELVTFTTKGDTVLDKSLPAIGGKGLFTEELERALLAGEIDCAVHSLKDLPTEQPAGLTIGAVPKRAAVEDVLISKHNLTLDKLPLGAKIGTSSLRRAAQLRHYRRDFEIIDLRGNVPTRINKALDPDGEYDAIVLAQAGVERLGLMDKVTQIIPLEIMLPAPGQGAIAVQCRDEPETYLRLLVGIDDSETSTAVEAERAFLAQLEGGCSVPVAAYATWIPQESLILGENEKKVSLEGLKFTGRVASVDGSKIINVYHYDGTIQMKRFQSDSAKDIAGWAARDAIHQGADKILAEVKNVTHE